MNYVNKNIKITLKNGYNFSGKVTYEDNSRIDLIDIKGEDVSISKDSIMFSKVIKK